jgi:hypothetical protein
MRLDGAPGHDGSSRGAQSRRGSILRTKTILILRAGVMADTAFAQDIFAFSRRTLARHKRIRRTEFAD